MIQHDEIEIVSSLREFRFQITGFQKSLSVVRFCSHISSLPDWYCLDR
jgi:hypothetical protein